MTPRQQWFVAFCAIATLSVIGLIFTIGSTPHYKLQFDSCGQAREAGAPLPIHQGDVGWNKALDPDGNGVEC